MSGLGALGILLFLIIIFIGMTHGFIDETKQLCSEGKYSMNLHNSTFVYDNGVCIMSRPIYNMSISVSCHNFLYRAEVIIRSNNLTKEWIKNNIKGNGIRCEVMEL